jgi:hypothetical protein
MQVTETISSMAPSLERLALLVLTASLAACGGTGSSDTGACSAGVMACGGDVVGTWKYTRYCNPDLLPFGPNGDCVDTANVTFGGSNTITFASDGTYTSTQTADDHETMTVFSECALGATTACSSLNASTTTDGIAFEQTCTGSAPGNCSCVASQTGTSTTTGKYTIGGSTLTFSSSAGESNGMSNYCVQGSELDLGIWIHEGVHAGSTPVYAIYTKQ